MTICNAQNIKRDKILYLERCSTDSLSLCGNYFDQDKMRLPLLLEKNIENKITYDTIYILNSDDSLILEKLVLNSASKEIVKCSDKFFRVARKIIKRNNYRESPVREFRYSKLALEFQSEDIGYEDVFVLNPNPKSDDDLFLKLKCKAYKISHLVSYSLLD